MINSSRVDFDSQSELVTVDVNVNSTIQIIIAYNPDQLNLTRLVRSLCWFDYIDAMSLSVYCTQWFKHAVRRCKWASITWHVSVQLVCSILFQSQPISQLNITLTCEKNISVLLFVTDLSVYSSHKTLPTLSSSDLDAMIVKLFVIAITQVDKCSWFSLEKSW